MTGPARRTRARPGRIRRVLARYCVPLLTRLPSRAWPGNEKALREEALPAVARDDVLVEAHAVERRADGVRLMPSAAASCLNC